MTGNIDPSTQTFKLKVLTFNLWAVPYVGVATEERVDAFIAMLRENPLAYDLIGFQEVFIPYAINALKTELPALGFNHIVYFTSGVDMPSDAVGSGCMIASRYPILDSAWHPFTTGGRPYRIDQWDWHAGKGIGLARVLLPQEFGTADVYVSHFQAQYHDAPHDGYQDQRVLQALESSVFIRTTRRSDLTLMLGDINSGPDSLVYKTLATLAGFKDAYSCTHTKEDELLHGSTLTGTRALVTPSLEPSRMVRSIYDSTFGSSQNVFSAEQGPSCDVNARLLHRTWHVLNSDIRLTEHIKLRNGRKINLSDHSAVYAELACVLIRPDKVSHTPSPNSSHQTLNSADLVTAHKDHRAAELSAPSDESTSMDAGEDSHGHEMKRSLSNTNLAAVVKQQQQHQHRYKPRLSKSFSDSNIFEKHHATDESLRRAIVAAGVSLDRCADLSADMQRQHSVDVTAGLHVRTDITEPHDLMETQTQDNSVWKDVLQQCEQCMMSGLASTKLLRNMQAIAGNVFFAIALCIAMYLSWSSSKQAVSAGAVIFHALFFAAGFSWAYIVILRSGTLTRAILRIVSLVCVGVAITVATWAQLGGTSGLLASFAIGCCPLGVLCFFIGMFLTSAEVSGYERALQQVRTLMQRPPAVVA